MLRRLSPTAFREMEVDRLNLAMRRRLACAISPPALRWPPSGRRRCHSARRAHFRLIARRAFLAEMHEGGFRASR